MPNEPVFIRFPNEKKLSLIKIFQVSTFLNQVKRYINKNSLFSKEDKLLIALSGGLDSMVLTHLLFQLDFHIAVAHCNFQLRGTDSDADEEFVEAFAKMHKIPFYSKAFDTKAFAKEKKLSTQLAARALRYAWFDEVMKDQGYDYLVTAHHANDQVETMLYNMTKGTGIAGLRGIPLKNDQIRRPLLSIPKADIEAYAKKHQLPWREDVSNQEDKYSRNRLRLNVIPELKQLNPGLEQTLTNNSKRFEALEKLLLHQASTIKSQYLSKYQDSYSLELSWFDEENGGLAILIEILKPFGFNLDQCFSIAEGLSKTSGKQYLSSDYALTTDRSKLQITPKGETKNFLLTITDFPNQITTPWADFSIERVAAQKDWPKDGQVACLDADLVKFPLKVRNWEQGDSFYPLGMKGKKKLSDFMIDEKIPVNLKSRVMLFESDHDIIWVAGYRIDDRYKITSNTKNLLLIKMTNHV
ncbi:MAG: tRNA lysidine(34) synthetase TilS [Reichenbachiella sp.]|uniref:tRNA lysidine(34) synthetase TilS n=1 Tax=Reichenbachiella sp. TaxID=2184521 RepID=UPI002967560C|nr:tRNA lysidine(34) synthetase TilS [Reichenbachiella sp.]MDW3209700.1 tRNA lysidine(34) synthetase TilS [Reichenbachiella sp.]